ALSGYGQDKERSQATGARFDHHLIKPVGADQLLDLVQQMIG
ncbi:MAG: hypothetical protein JWQ76_5577, partial [Ramlibacter sp.]|nr:hypothetical protein [Ramlibacter sp.]